MNPSQIRAKEDQDFAAGTWGGEFHPEFGPLDGDVIVFEHWAKSGFANTDLDSQLKMVPLIGMNEEIIFSSNALLILSVNFCNVVK
jgi:nicotinamidase-related amidase